MGFCYSYENMTPLKMNLCFCSNFGNINTDNHMMYFLISNCTIPLKKYSNNINYSPVVKLYDLGNEIYQLNWK